MVKVVGWLMFEYDGISDVYVKDFKIFEDVFKDLEYVEKICLDELVFIDVQNI